MSGLQVRQSSAYESDPGTGVEIRATPQMVEIGMTWDGAERMVVRVDPTRLIEICEEARDWTAG